MYEDQDPEPFYPIVTENGIVGLTVEDIVTLIENACAFAKAQAIPPPCDREGARNVGLKAVAQSVSQGLRAALLQLPPDDSPPESYGFVRFFSAYREAAIQLAPENPRRLTDIDSQSLGLMESECREFWNTAVRFLESGDDYSRAGTDFYLTRNGHGVGFWDESRWSHTLGTLLTQEAKAYGESELYPGDDGYLYLYPPAFAAGECE